MAPSCGDYLEPRLLVLVVVLVVVVESPGFPPPSFDDKDDDDNDDDSASPLVPGLGAILQPFSTTRHPTSLGPTSREMRVSLPSRRMGAGRWCHSS